MSKAPVVLVAVVVSATIASAGGGSSEELLEVRLAVGAGDVVRFRETDACTTRLGDERMTEEHGREYTVTVKALRADGAPTWRSCSTACA